MDERRVGIVYPNKFNQKTRSRSNPVDPNLNPLNRVNEAFHCFKEEKNPFFRQL